MKLALYLDECISDKDLVRRLQAAGHTVHTPTTANLSGENDGPLFQRLCQLNLVLITKNPSDFQQIHKQLTGAGGQHSGILAVYLKNRPQDMDNAAIVQAIANLAAAYPDRAALRNQFLPLNSFNY